MDQAVADFRAAYRRDEIGARYSGWLRRLHLQHHDPALMMRRNFNITHPVGDWLFGTPYRRRHDAGS